MVGYIIHGYSHDADVTADIRTLLPSEMSRGIMHRARFATP